MQLDHYVTLGRSGLRVSPLCLGAMTFGEDLGWGSSVEDSKAILDRYLAAGGNFIDTANMYTFGHSETILGEHLGKRRDRVVLATKFFTNLIPGDPNGGGAGRKAVTAACEQSLRRLKTDYIDLYWMHAWDHHTPIDETMRALDDLVRAGKVRYLGFSDTPAWKVAQAQTKAELRDWSPLIALQIEYSLLERTVEGELTPMARELGLGVTPWSPLKGGLLSGKYTRENAGKGQTKREWNAMYLNEKTYKVIDELLQVAKEVDTSPARAALAWVMAQPGVTSTIIGARTMEQLEQNLGGLSVKLSPSQLARLAEVSKPTLNFPADMLQMTPGMMHPDLTVNGQSAARIPYAPGPNDKVW
jgi:aryl-alcohol dehydrogenase-like predicted oxidoreductase